MLNQKLQLKLSQKLSPQQIQLMKLIQLTTAELEQKIKNEIEELLDHKNLNLDVPYFKKVIPTAENICIFIWNILRDKI